MILELHVLQNVAPNNLNRNDVGAPKDCIFGGTRRARVSSQSWKRAMRDLFDRDNLIPAEHRAVRSKRLIGTIAELLEGRGRDPEAAALVAEAMLGGLGLGTDDQGKTQYLLYLGAAEIDNLAEYADSHWDAFQRVADPDTPARERKKAAKEAVDRATQRELQERLDGGRAADLALFGRMLADLPARNVDGAAQVAHAISTNAVEVEFDFYTAVDDLRPEDTEGADMLGTVEFVSSTLYRYANLDLAALTANLSGDRELAQATARTFAEAFVRSMPTGKQNSMAAHNPPSIVVAVVRETGRWSLANAFIEAVRPHRHEDLMALSIARLADYWDRLTGMYGGDGIVSTPTLVDAAYREEASPFGHDVPGLRAWLDRVDADLPHQGASA